VTYRPKFFTYGFRYLLVEIFAPGGARAPVAPPAPLPEGDAFVHCTDGKHIRYAYPIVTFQYSSTTLYQFSYHIQ
jgi:hypothetical protein